MKSARAHEILQALVEGNDPITGEPLPPKSTLHHGDVLRALVKAVDVLKLDVARQGRRAALPKNVGRSWSKTEETELARRFRAKESIETIATQHGRTTRAIESRLQRLGLITANERTTFAAYETIPPAKSDIARKVARSRNRKL